MTPADVSALSQRLTGFCRRKLRYAPRHGVAIDVHDLPRDVRDRLRDQIAQATGRKGRDWDVRVDNGFVKVADRRTE